MVKRTVINFGNDCGDVSVEDCLYDKQKKFFADKDAERKAEKNKGQLWINKFMLTIINGLVVVTLILSMWYISKSWNMTVRESSVLFTLLGVTLFIWSCVYVELWNNIEKRFGVE